MSKVIQPIKSGSLVNQVYESLRQAIFEGELRPGDGLREAHLARALQVSQATVREALVQLSHTGLVVRVPNRETTVTKFSKQELHERMAIRRKLEELAFYEAMPRLTGEDFAALEVIIETISATVARQKYVETAQADVDFHRFVWQRSGNVTLYEMLDRLVAPIFAYISMLRRDGVDMNVDIVQQHTMLVDALRTRKVKVLAGALQQHFMESKVFPEAAR